MQLRLRSICLLCPCSVEYEACRDGLCTSVERCELGRRVSETDIGALHLYCMESGFGKIGSATAAQYAADIWKPEVLLDLGAAGSLNDGVDLFDFVFADRSFEYDVVSFKLFERFSDSLDIETLWPALRNSEKRKLHAFFSTYAATHGNRIHIGPIACGERNVDNPRFRRSLADRFGAIAANWESSAVLQVAKANAIKAMSIRVITDRADGSMLNDLRTNWRFAMDRLAALLREMLESDLIDCLLDRD